jgi:hypothetical protein
MHLFGRASLTHGQRKKTGKNKLKKLFIHLVAENPSPAATALAKKV